MKVGTALIVPVLILLSILTITLFSYFELESVFVFTDIILESHAINLLLLDDLKTQINYLETHTLQIKNNDNISREDLENSLEEILSTKIKMYEILESNVNLDSNFVTTFTVSTDILFEKFNLLYDEVYVENPRELTSLLSQIDNELIGIHVLLDSEFTNEKTTFFILHNLAQEKYSYGNTLLIIVIVTNIFLIASISFWIYKTFRLTAQDTQKTEFASMITHELKTPLNPILNACEMLNAEILGKLNASQKEETERIQRNALYLLQIIVDILDAQKLDMGKLVFSNTKFKLSELFNELKSDNEQILREKNVTLKLDLRDDLIISSDKNRIRQIFNNLIKNSLDFVKPNTGLIKIGSFRKKEQLIFFVEDNGIGIEKSEQSNLFKSFYQVDTSIKRKHGGTGLGLTVCKGIVEGLNGKIWIKSEPKKGTSIFFSIPI